MPHLISKLISCVPRRHDHRKNIQRIIPNEKTILLKMSRFELLTDEILIEIFEYLSVLDLYTAFVHLNLRLNILLRDVHLGITFNENIKPKKSLRNALEYFSKQILYIHIDCNPSLNLEIYPNLRSLIVYLPTRDQLLSINRIQMPSLSRLCLGKVDQKDEMILWNTLFGSQQFLQLRYCSFFQLNLHVNSSLIKCSFLNLRRLFVSNCTTNHFLLFLSSLPNLKQLEIVLSNVRIPSSFHFPRTSHRNLQILKIEFEEKVSSLDSMNYFLWCVPALQRLTLYFIHLISITDYISLEQIILEKLIELEQFICSIDYSCQLSSNQMIPEFHRLQSQSTFLERSMKIIPCFTHQDQCLRKIWIHQTFLSVS